MTPTFTPSRHFRRQYDRVFRRDPLAANVLLLLSELADEKGAVAFGPQPGARFNGSCSRTSRIVAHTSYQGARHDRGRT